MKKLLGLILMCLHLTSSALPKPDEKPSFADDDKPGVIKGVIVDEKTDQPMEYANVAVYDQQDSTLVSGGITDSEGEFEITGMSYGDYYLQANFIGFIKKEIPDIELSKNNPLFDSGKIELKPSAVELGGVNVVADKARIEYKLDKKVINVSQDINAIGGTAVDVLENTPSVQVDIEGNVSLRGSSNFTVFIDGRPSVLSGSEALRQIPASAIKNIEIITNPSAKYDPDGTAGIINLVMKKNAMKGINGIVNATVGTRNKYRGDFTLNYRTQKFNFFVGADWRDETYYGSMISKRETYLNDTTKYLDMDGSRNFTRGGHNYKSGIDLYLSDNSTLSLSGELGKSKSNRGGSGKTHAYTQPSSEEIFSVTDETSDRNNDFYSGTMNFQHKFNDKGHKIEAMAFYSGDSGTDNEEETEVLSDAQYQKTNEYLARVFTTELEDEKDLRLKVDYTYPFSETGRLEAGWQSRLESDNEQMLFKDYDQATDTWVVNDTYSSSTDFSRNIHAAYTTYSNKLGGIEYMAGLRGELTNREITNTNASGPSTLNRFDLFPTLHFSYKLKKTNELMASYSRRINRPRGRDLDPSANYYNRYTIRYGNPDLKPEYTDSYELGILKRFGESRSYVSLDGFHRVTHNKIDWIETLGEDGIFYLNSDNFDEDYSTGFELTGNINFAKWLLVNGSVSMYNYRITGNLSGQSINRESTNWNGRINTTFKFSPDARLQITGFYRGPSVTAQGESKAMFFSNISYRQEFMDKKLSATLSVRDPLGTGKFERESYGTDFKNYFKWSREPRIVMLTLSYKINNFKSNERGGDNQGGGDMDYGGGEM